MRREFTAKVEEQARERGDREFRCNNNWTAALARWSMEFDPSLRGLFDLRERKTEK